SGEVGRVGDIEVGRAGAKDIARPHESHLNVSDRRVGEGQATAIREVLGVLGPPGVEASWGQVGYVHAEVAVVVGGHAGVLVARPERSQAQGQGDGDGVSWVGR